MTIVTMAMSSGSCRTNRKPSAEVGEVAAHGRPPDLAASIAPGVGVRGSRTNTATIAADARKLAASSAMTARRPAVRRRAARRRERPAASRRG